MEGSGLEESMQELSKEYYLSLGMVFELEDDAYDFYNDHATIMGFSVRRRYRTTSKKDGRIINRKFVFGKEGDREIDNQSLVVESPRSETRTKCNAFMYIAFNPNQNAL